MNDEYPVFLGLEAEPPAWKDAAAVILPLPYERTVSWGEGTENGPRALLEASEYIELYDEELECEPHRHGFYTAPPVIAAAEDPATALDEIEDEVRRHMAAGKFVVSVGGEHGVTLAPARAAADVFGLDLGIVQFDAHADLRDTYHGTPYSHASVMRRVVDDVGLSLLPVGLRAITSEEAALIRDRDIPTIWSHEVHADALSGSTARFEDLLQQLPDQVYLTFDIDFFDPSLIPATGTPEPGGGFWHPTMALLRTLFREKTVVAMDVVELAPIAGQPASDFVAAKLIYKCLGYLFDDGPG
ncbi:MAG: agmatinase [Acidobacteriota bacterium]